MDGYLMDLAKQGLSVAGFVTGWVMIPILIVGLFVAVFQAATQINEASLSFVPKLIVIFFIILFLGEVLLGSLLDFTTEVLVSISEVVK